MSFGAFLSQGSCRLLTYFRGFVRSYYTRTSIPINPAPSARIQQVLSFDMSWIVLGFTTGLIVLVVLCWLLSNG